MAQYNLGTAHGSVQIDSDTSGITAAQRALNDLNTQSNNTGGGLGNLNRQGRAAAGGLSIVSSTVVVMATKMAIATAAGAGLIAIAAELSGIVGLLPAAAIAGGLAMGTLTAGMKGFGDALKNMGDPEAFAESLEKLAPQAREAAVAVKELAPAWRGMQQAVQNQLFAETGLRITALSNQYLPMLRSSMVDTAEGMNGALHDVIDMLQETGRQSDISTVLGHSSAAVSNLAHMFRPLISVLLDLAVVGAPIIERLSASALAATERFAAFVSEARKTGELQAWIQRGLDAFADLWNIISLLTGTVINLVSAFGGPDSLLGVLTMVATALNVVSAFIDQHRAVIGPLMVVIGSLVGLYKIWTIATATWASITAAQTAIANSAILRTLATQTMVALRWIGNFLLMSAAAVAWVAVQVAQGAIAVAKWLVNFAIMSAATIAWVAVQIVQAGIVMARWVAMAAVAVVQAGIMAAAWIASTVAGAAVAVASTLVAVASIVAGWIVMAATALASAASAALAWFIALGPIGWAIAALIAVVAFIIIFWDDIKGYFIAAGQFLASVMQSIWQGIVNVWNMIVAAFTAAGQAIWGAITTMVNWIVTGLTNAMNFIIALPGRIIGVFAAAGTWLINAGRNIINGLVNGISALIGMVGSAASNAGRAVLNAFSGAASWLWNAGGDLLRGLWNGISNAAGWLYNKIRNWASGLIDGVLGFFGISSPSRVFAEMGDFLMQGMAEGIDDSAALAIRAAESAAQGVLDIMNGSLDTGSIDAIIGDSLSDASLAALLTTTPVAGGTVGTAAASAAGTLVPAGAGATAGVGAGGVGSTVHFELNTYNPIAERASDSEARKIRAAAAVGSF